MAELSYRLERDGTIHALCDVQGSGRRPATPAEVELFAEVERLRVALDAIRAGAAVNRGFDAVWCEIAAASLAGREPEGVRARAWLDTARLAREARP